MKFNAETKTFDEKTVDYYEVIVAGNQVFRSECRAICNSYICRNMIQGVRPTPVFIEED